MSIYIFLNDLKIKVESRFHFFFLSSSIIMKIKRNTSLTRVVPRRSLDCCCGVTLFAHVLKKTYRAALLLLLLLPFFFAIVYIPQPQERRDRFLLLFSRVSGMKRSLCSSFFDSHQLSKTIIGSSPGGGRDAPVRCLRLLLLTASGVSRTNCQIIYNRSTS